MCTGRMDEKIHPCLHSNLKNYFGISIGVREDMKEQEEQETRQEKKNIKKITAIQRN